MAGASALEVETHGDGEGGAGHLCGEVVGAGMSGAATTGVVEAVVGLWWAAADGTLAEGAETALGSEGGFWVEVNALGVEVSQQ